MDLSLSFLLSSVFLFPYILFPLFCSKFIRNAPIATKSIKDSRGKDSVLFYTKLESSSLICHEVNVERLRGTYAMRTLISNGSLSLSLLQLPAFLFPYLLSLCFILNLSETPHLPRSLSKTEEREIHSYFT